MSASENNLVLRELRVSDCEAIALAFKQQGWNKPVAQYQTYLELRQKGERDIILAELESSFAGYLTIQWQSDYPPFRGNGIPEIVDFNVLKKYQRLGIGSRMMDEAERRIKQRSDYAGIGFGVTRDYGAAQILYTKRNYIPDGKGLMKHHTPLKYADQIIVDDDIVMYLIKQL
jgi:ribosomal protein S18 acetylase RimI-like enzyme